MERKSLPATNAVRRLGSIDILIIIAVVTGAFAFFPVAGAGGRSEVSVRCDSRVIARYPLDRCCVFRVQGVEGPVDIRIDGEGVAVVHAACRNQICVHTGHVSRPCQRIICAPNHLVIEVESKNADDAPDAVAR